LGPDNDARPNAQNTKQEITKMSIFPIQIRSNDRKSAKKRDETIKRVKNDKHLILTQNPRQ
jgi:hypothetical protein